MTIATVGKRYQVVIPMRERQKLNIKPNSKVEIEVVTDRATLKPRWHAASPSARRAAVRWFGCTRVLASGLTMVTRDSLWIQVL